MVTREEVVNIASGRAFGRPLIVNVFRGHLVEAMLAIALEPDWRWCSQDYAGWDFENLQGFRLEVKQSAARQSWAPPKHGAASPRFDIRARTGHWEGAVWIAGGTRLSSIYVFAWHGVADDAADHRCPNQWRFYLVPETQLPDQKSISLAHIQRLSVSVGLDEVRDALALLTLAPTSQPQ